MLRRVKTNVVSELTRKTEVTLHCKLSSRQQAFYRLLRTRYLLPSCFEGNRGHLNEKKILNLMNIVIQLRKVYYGFYWGFVLSTSSFQKYNLSTPWGEENVEIHEFCVHNV